jgi:hypothetical protein
VFVFGHVGFDRFAHELDGGVARVGDAPVGVDDLFHLDLLGPPVDLLVGVGVGVGVGVVVVASS